MSAAEVLTPGILAAEVLTLLAEQAPPGSPVVPWWLRIGVLVYGALLVAALMIYAQTRHQRPWGVLWVLIIAFVPIVGAISYFIAQTLTHRRGGQRPTKGRAERLPPEDFTDQR
ncbi:PLD nuclease N-terminal domain-containing protein [Nesterenkonia muleiensis]|uniref:PLD nuclease N-terminal domain-containing protein n=1 Tax=Nesterenkonia muleiensis TaxID=2282648 RepID=UPI000E76F0FD|nr:PLD nuclease N-terminal domain-containing protein [Nesterenkonia muleiensis]